MKGVGPIVAGVVILVLVILIGASAYVVDETQQIVITQFGRPVGDPIIEPGLHWRIPFVQKPRAFEKRFLEWDGDRNQLPTRDKRFIFVDSYARWRITDPKRFLERLTDERRAQTRLDDILDGETRNTIARHELIEVVRVSNREFTVVEELGSQDVDEIVIIESGRDVLAAEILAAASKRVLDLGIEVLDFRIKRLNYVPEVRRKVYERMISERNRIAEQFRSEGAGEAARINGEKERELRKIRSEAYRKAQEIKGRADAEAADIYAKAYNRDPEFYRFLKSMDVLRETLDSETTLLLTTGGDLLHYLESSK